MSETLVIPVDSLDEKLRELIPFGEKIVYTSKVRVSKPGWRLTSKHGYLVLTPSGVAFRAGKLESEKDLFEGYVPYTNMVEVKSKKGTVEFKIKNPNRPSKKRGWKLKVVRCEDEDKKSFKNREELFTQIFEDLMKR
ncbi:hypothetical protein GWO13_07260, partial [Candidatus Bathyarchaeota archaeon]|nr:hypothetical protein [Candidatus Bathyarchaeota archaeon]